MLQTSARSHPVQITEVILPGLVELSGLQLQQRTLAVPVAGQALVQVEATGISFAEQGMRRGGYPGQPKFPFVPGVEVTEPSACGQLLRLP